jgi:hypothetical protein
VICTSAKASATVRGETKEIKNPNTKKSKGSMIRVRVNIEKNVAYAVALVSPNRLLRFLVLMILSETYDPKIIVSTEII